MKTIPPDLTTLKTNGNVVEFPFWATKDFETSTGLDKKSFESHTPETLQIAYRLSFERYTTASMILEEATDDGIRESPTGVMAMYEMLNDAEERMGEIKNYLISKGWAYEILPDGVLHFPFLDNSP